MEKAKKKRCGTHLLIRENPSWAATCRQRQGEKSAPFHAGYCFCTGSCAAVLFESFIAGVTYCAEKIRPPERQSSTPGDGSPSLGRPIPRN